VDKARDDGGKMKKRRLENGEASKLIVLGFMIAFCLFVTYYFHFILKNDTIFTHLFYIPIILASLWWQRKGIAVAVFLALQLIVLDIISPLETPIIGSDIARALIFILVGTVVAILSERKQILADRLQTYGRTLEQQVEERTNELRQSEEKQRAVLEGIGDAVLVLDEGLNIVWANRVAVNQYGAVIGRKCYEACKWLQEPCSECVARKTYADGVLRTSEEENILKDGNRIKFMASCSPIRNPDGEVICIVKVLHDITEHKRAEDQIKASLREKEVLLLEIHHRVKNNLQIVSSLLNMQARNAKDKDTIEILSESRDRIITMSLIHSQLYESKNLSEINMKGFMDKLLVQLLQISPVQDVKITPIVHTCDCSLPISIAVPVGLIVNELLSNASKHAFADRKEGEIEVSLTASEDGKINLTVSDDGVGLPPGFDIDESKTLGLRLVKILAEDQLQGNIEVTSDGGATFRIEFDMDGDESAGGPGGKI
jgi:PAS domain S-box-containing protein